jgi:hypothetical protein
VLVRLYAVSGQMIVEKVFENAHALYREGLDIRKVQNGVYLFEVVTGNRQHRQKVMVVHP